MSASPTTKKRSLKQWQSTVDAVLTDVEQWCVQAGWLVHSSELSIDEDSTGTYKTRQLQIKTPIDHLFVQPIGRDIVAADGRIDIYAWPSLYRAILILHGKKWVLLDDFGKKWPTPWSRETFIDVAQKLTSAK